MSRLTIVVTTLMVMACTVGCNHRVRTLPAVAPTEVTYYVDYDGGSDDQGGTSPAAAFRHAPGDPAATGRAAVALDHFGRAMELDPGFEDARFARAIALLEVGERDEAVFALDMYLREFPDGAWSESARAELEGLAREAGEIAP